MLVQIVLGCGFALWIWPSLPVVSLVLACLWISFCPPAALLRWLERRSPTVRYSLPPLEPPKALERRSFSTDIRQPSVDEFGSDERPVIYLTVDDAPSAHTGLILDALAEPDPIGPHSAMFFVIGSYVVRHSNELRAIFKAGHSFGNHDAENCVTASPFRSTDELIFRLAWTESLVRHELITATAATSSTNSNLAPPIPGNCSDDRNSSSSSSSCSGASNRTSSSAHSSRGGRAANVKANAAKQLSTSIGC